MEVREKTYAKVMYLKVQKKWRISIFLGKIRDVFKSVLLIQGLLANQDGTARPKRFLTGQIKQEVFRCL